MKHLLLLTLISLGVYASDITWFNTYAEGSKTAINGHKPMLVFMQKPGCGSCEYMKENVFTDTDIIAYLNEHYISIALNIQDNDAPKNLQVNMTPVFYFLNSDGSQAQERLVGGKTAPFFLKLLKQAKAVAH